MNFDFKQSFRNKGNQVYIAIIFIACFFLYGSTVFNDYSLDDDLVTANNETVKKGIKGIPEIFTTLYKNIDNFKYEYRPIVKVTYALEHQIFSSNPRVSHFFNILIYFLVSLLLFYVLIRIFTKQSVFFVFFIVLLFVAHPVHSEVVASLKNRDELLSFGFSLLTLFITLKLGENNKIKHYFFIFLFFLLALLSKQSAMVFIAICPLTLFFVNKEIPLKRILILFFILSAALILTKFVQSSLVGKAQRDLFFWDNPLYFVDSFSVRTATGMSVLLFYLKLLIFPHPLLFYYGYNMIPLSDWSQPSVIISLMLHLILLIFGIILTGKRHPLGYGILFYLIAISMFSNIIRSAAGIVAERYVFSASLGFVIMFASLIFLLFKSLQVKAPGRKQVVLITSILILILIPYSIKTKERCRDWKNHFTLYSADIRYLENSAKANELYASELARQVNVDMLKTKDLEKNMPKILLSVKHFEQSLRIDSSNFSAYNNLGLINFVLLKNNKKAIEYFKKSLIYKPNYERGNFNLALVYESISEYDSAIIYYKKVNIIDPTNINAFINQANILYYKKNRFTDAVDLMKKYSMSNSDNALPYITIGTYYLQNKDTLNCLSYFEIAAEKPNIEARFLHALSQIYTARHQPDKAAYYLRKALSVKGKN